MFSMARWRPIRAALSVLLSATLAHSLARTSAIRIGTTNCKELAAATTRGVRSSSRTMCCAKKGDGNVDGDADGEQGENAVPSFKQQTWNPLRLGVLRLGLTEPAMTSPLNYGKYDGQFNCAYCGQLLFDSTAKFDSGTGWPSFWRTAGSDLVKYKRELNGSLECQCQRCSSHLGHVFLDGPRPLTVAAEVLAGKPASDPERTDGKYLPRYCMNGAALTYTARDQSTPLSDAP